MKNNLLPLGIYALFAFLATANAQTNPDQIYPVAPLYGAEIYKGVNLFTGDVNYQLNLVSVQSKLLSYDLDMLYNSRSAGTGTFFTENPLGGLGWKLMDYPKVVQDVGSGLFYLLDGKQAYALDTLQKSSTQIQFSASGDFHLWNANMGNLTAGTANRSWTLVSENGARYVFRTSAVTNNPQSLCWNLSAIYEAQNRDSILFTYNYGYLSSIQTADLSTWTFAYDSRHRIISVENGANTKSDVVYYQNKKLLNYDAKFPNTLLTQLSSIHYLQNVAPPPYKEAQYQIAAPPTLFSYYQTGYPGALERIVGPSGGELAYQYANYSWNDQQYHIVSAVNSFSGNNYELDGKMVPMANPVSLHFTGPKALLLHEISQFNLPGTKTKKDTVDLTYLHFNECEIVPGAANLTYDKIGDSSTSFENDGSDPVFTNVKTSAVSQDYALSGKKSYFFDTQDIVGETVLKSKRFDLTRKTFDLGSGDKGGSSSITMSGSKDSVRLAFYILQTHDHLDVTYICAVSFYDSKNKMIDGGGYWNEEIGNENFGNWVLVEKVAPIPDNAVSFDFYIMGGRAVDHYDFYCDDVSVSGSHNTVNGRVVYHFINGNEARSLMHLPGSYVTPFPDQQVKNIYETGFETGENFADWLNLDHGKDCEPVATLNSGTKCIANNGSSALRMRMCSDAHSRIYPKQSKLNIPSGTDKILLSFTCSSPQFSGMQFKVDAAVGKATWDTTVTLSGSYFTDPHYSRIYKWFSVTNTSDEFNFTISASNAGGGKGINEFYLDDLQLVFLDVDKSPALPVTNVRDPRYLGQAYHQAVFSQDNLELHSTEVFWIAGADAKANNTPLALPYREVNVEQCVTRTYTRNDYYPDGRKSGVQSTLEQRKPNETYQQTWYYEAYVYADSLYSALNRSGLHMLDQRAATVNSYSEDRGAHWNLLSGELISWARFSTPSAQSAHGSLGSLWMPAVDYSSKTSQSLSNVYSAIGRLANQKPSSTYWQIDHQLISLDANGLPYQTRSADSLLHWTLNSQWVAEDANNVRMNRNPLPVAQFNNASPQNSFYCGFEDYEYIQGFDYRTEDEYSHSGLRSATQGVNFSFNFRQGENAVGLYLLSFYYLINSSTDKITVQVQSGATNILNRPIASASPEWQLFQALINVPEGASTVLFSISMPKSGYLDDLLFMPAEASCNINVYDIYNYQPRSGLNDAGAETRMLYNWKGSAFAVVGGNNAPLSFQTNFLSRMDVQGSGLYNSLQPNNQATIKARDGGRYYAFNDPADLQDWGISTVASVDNQSLICDSAVNATLQNFRDFKLDADNFGMSFQIFPIFFSSTTAQSLETGCSIGNYQFITEVAHGATQDTIGLYLAFGKVRTQIARFQLNSDLFNPVYDVMVVFQENHVHVWFNDQYFYKKILYYQAPQNGALSFFFTPKAGTPQLQVKNLCVFVSPEVQMAFQDGMGNVLQQQTVDGNDLIVEEILYDFMQRPVLDTKKALLANTYPGFQPDFVQSFDWATGVMQGLVQNAQNYVYNGSTDQNYLYQRNIWKPSPQMEISREYQPGFDFALRSQTNKEKAIQWYFDHSKVINDVIKYSVDAVTIIVDPESAPFIITTDLIGLGMEFFHLSTKNQQKEQAITSRYYDAFLRQTQINLPWANSKTAPKPQQVLRYGYDFQGNMTWRYAPESGGTRCAYDGLGRLRFSQDSAQAANNKVKFYKYDKKSRPLESGLMTYTWDQQKLESAANNPSYPTNGAKTSAYIYGDNQIGANRGRLVQSNAYSENGINSTYTLSYDLQGRIASNTVLIGNQASYVTSYTYDNLDNIRLIQYPTWNSYRFQVRYAYDYAGNLSEIGDSTASDKYVAYEWNPDGSPATERMPWGSGKNFWTKYTYNAPGWPLSFINSDTSAANMVSHFTLNLNYNFVSSKLAHFLGSKFYNGDIASAEYLPAKGNPARSYIQTYGYNDYGNLSEYHIEFGSPQQEGIFNSGHMWTRSDTVELDLNNNLVTFGSQYNEFQSAIAQYGDFNTASMSDVTNRSDRLYHQEYAYASSGSRQTRIDTLYQSYLNNGKVSSQVIVNRNWKVDYPLFYFPDPTQKFSRRFGWSANNMLANSSYNNVNNDSTYITYGYGPDNMRLKKTVTHFKNGKSQGSRTTTYIRNSNGDPLMEIITGGTDDTVKYYVLGPNGIANMCLNSSYNNHARSNFRSYIVLKDNQGSARQLVDRSDGSVKEYYGTDAYGMLMTDSCTQYQGLFNYIYTGQEYDRETGLHYFRSRLYDPFSRMFLSPDPAGANPATPYAFVNNDPVNETDPSGNIPFFDIFEESEEEIAKAMEEYADKSIIEVIARSKVGPMERRKRAKMAFMGRFDNPEKYAADFDYIVQNHNSQFMPNYLRAGGDHEFLQVAQWRIMQKKGVRLRLIQELTVPTKEMGFQLRDMKLLVESGEDGFLNVEIPHGDKATIPEDQRAAFAEFESAAYDDPDEHYVEDDRITSVVAHQWGEIVIQGAPKGEENVFNAVAKFYNGEMCTPMRGNRTARNKINWIRQKYRFKPYPTIKPNK